MFRILITGSLVEIAKAAIFVDPSYARFNCSVARTGSRFVAVNYGQYLLISIYIPPSIDLRCFNDTLDKLSL